MKRTLAGRIRSSLPFLRDRTNPVTGIAYRYDAEAMRRAEGNQSIAARLLGISRTALNKRLNHGED